MSSSAQPEPFAPVSPSAEPPLLSGQEEITRSDGLFHEKQAVPQRITPVATNTMAVLAIVLVWFVWPAGVLLGHVARAQIRQTGERGYGLATAALWVGYLCLGFMALVILAIALSFK